MKKLFQFTAAAAAGALLHAAAGLPQVAALLGVTGQAMLRVLIWAGVLLCLISIFRSRP